MDDSNEAPPIAFRDHLTRNFEKVVSLSDTNFKKLNDIEQFYRKRAQTEIKHGQELQKLCQQYQETNSTNEKSANASFDKIIEETFKTAQSCELRAQGYALATTYNSVAQIIHNCSDVYNAGRKLLTEQGRAKLKELEDSYSELKKAKLTYDSARKEAKELKYQLEAAKNNYQMAGKAQKLQIKHEAARSKRKLAKETFVLGEQKSTASQHNYYYKDIPLLLDKFQELEQWRVGWIKDALVEGNLHTLKFYDDSGKRACDLAEKLKRTEINHDLNEFVLFWSEKPKNDTEISVMSLVNPDMTGRMQISTKEITDGGSARWKEYYFVLMGKKLYTFDSENAKSVTNSEILQEGERVIRPCGKSLFQRDFVFQFKNISGHYTYFACPTRDSFTKWYSLLLKAAGVKSGIYEDKERCIQSLKVKILEAKGLPMGNYYAFCCLDSEYQERTLTKSNTTAPFWAEEFHFNALPKDFFNLVIYVVWSARQKVTGRVSDEQYGCITINKSSMEEKENFEKWIPINRMVAVQTEEEVPSLRMHYSFTNEKIFPISHYIDLAHTLWNEEVLKCVNTVINPSDREKTARTLLTIYRSWGKCVEFLNDLTAIEIGSTDNVNIVFRSNSLATKALDQWMKISAMDFLNRALRSFCEEVYNMRTSSQVEVDPTRVANSNDIKANFKRLYELTEKAWNSILHAMKNPPPFEVRAVFHHLQKLAIEKFQDDVAKYTTISGLLFLRFICPAILNPKLFHIMPKHPPEHTSRILTLIAKTIQNLANLVEFGAKEPYMADMNAFIKANVESFKQVIDDTCTIYPDDVRENLPSTDLPRELARIHNSLTSKIYEIQEYNIEFPSPGVKTLITCLEDLIVPFSDRRPIVKKSCLPDIFSIKSETEQNTAVDENVYAEPDKFSILDGNDDSETEKKKLVLVVYDFDAEGPTELSVKEGDQGYIIHDSVEGAEGWVDICVNGETGFVPKSYLSIGDAKENIQQLSDDSDWGELSDLNLSIPVISTEDSDKSITNSPPVYQKSETSNARKNCEINKPKPNNLFLKTSEESRPKSHASSGNNNLFEKSTNEERRPKSQINSVDTDDKPRYRKIDHGDWFYYEDMQRLDVNVFLPTQSNGAYLLRLSTQPTHKYTISLKFEGTLKHFRVRETSPLGYQVFGKSQVFATMPELLANYKTEKLTVKGEFLLQIV